MNCKHEWIPGGWDSHGPLMECIKGCGSGIRLPKEGYESIWSLWEKYHVRKEGSAREAAEALGTKRHKEMYGIT